MAKFNAIQTGIIVDSIKRAIAKVARGVAFMMSENDRADIAQTAFLKVLEGYNPLKATLIEGYSDDRAQLDNGELVASSALGGFAYRVAMNAATDFLRSRKGSRLDGRFVSMDASGNEDGETLGSILPDHTPDPRTLLAMKRRQMAADAALANLPQAYRDALIGEDDRAATGAERIRKLRALAKVQEDVIA